jgi:hypothetical protein
VDTVNAIGKEVEKLRAAGLTGIQQIRVKGKDYDIDLNSYKTGKDGGEWPECLHPVCPRAMLSYPLIFGA